MYGLSSFFIGEQKVAEELGPIMRAAPTEDQKIFLCTQIADEARHVRFFERFYREVGVLEADGLAEMLDRDLRAPQRQLRPPLRRDAEAAHRPALGRTGGHRGAGRGGDALPHGDRGDAGPHRAALHHGLQRTRGHAAGLRRGLPNVARDEHRHVAFGSVFLREKAHEDERYKAAIQRTLEESLPVADGVLSPPWAEGDEDFELFGYSLAETREFAGTCLMRRLKVIGLG